MKGYLKKMKSKRWLALIMAAFMVLTLCVPQTIHADGATDECTDTYEGNAVTIPDLLTYYQYVILGDAVLKNHTVGAVAVGNSLNSGNTIGDGAQMASFAQYISTPNGIIGNASGYGAVTRDFYYGNAALYDVVSSDFTYNPDFFGSADTVKIGNYSAVNEGMKNMFDTIQTESEGLYQGAEQVYVNTNSGMGFPTIDITLPEGGANIVIDYNDIKAAKAINLSIADINYLSNDAYNISIINTNGEKVCFDGEAYKGQANSEYIDVFVNGKQYAFLADLDNAIRGVECNLSGMKLVWNFPDATAVDWNAMGGHLVAPNAGVDVTSGRFEGGIIAKGVVSTGQAHYFPYNGISLNRLSNISIDKKYVDVDGKEVDLTDAKYDAFEHAQFGLFSDEDCKQPVLDTNSVAVTATVSATTGVASFDSQSLADAGSIDRTQLYYVKEISVDDRFEINSTVYVCQFNEYGLITYCELGKDAVPVFSSSSPVVENLVDSYGGGGVGTLIVTVQDKDTREKISDVEIKVTTTDENGDTVEVDATDYATTTNEQGVITFTGLDKGDYTVTMTIPDGYLSNTEYQVEVEVEETTYHTFELEQVKEPIVVYLKEEGSEDKITDGAWVLLQVPDATVANQWNTVSSAWSGSLGQVSFNDNLVGEYRVVLQTNPEGWDLVSTQTTEQGITIALDDGKDVNEHTFYFEQQVGSLDVNIYEYDSDTSTKTTDYIDVSGNQNATGATVRVTAEDGTVFEKVDEDKDGIVSFDNIPIGNATVELITAPTGYIKPDGDGLTSADVTIEKSSTAEADLYATEVKPTNIGRLEIITEKALDSLPDQTSGVKIQVTDPEGNVTEYPDNVIKNQIGVEDSFTLADITAGDYIVEIITIPDGWDTTSVEKQVVTVPANGLGQAKYIMTQTGAIEVSVVEKDTTVIVPGSTVVITDAADNEVYRGVTDDAVINVPDLPVGNYEITVTAPDTGYEESGKADIVVTPVEVTAGNTTEKEVELNPLGSLTVTVVDKDNTSVVVPGVKVTVKDSNGDEVGSGTTNNDGQVVIKDLPVGTYTAEYTDFAAGSTSAQVYVLSTSDADKKESATISSAVKDAEAQLEVLKATGSLDVTVQVKDDETPVEGATVTIKDPNGQVIQDGSGNDVHTTDANGKIPTLDDLELGDYTVIVESVPDTYDMPAETTIVVEVDKDGEEVVIEVTEKAPVSTPATLTIEVREDSESGNLVSGGTLTVTDPSSDAIIDEQEMLDGSEEITNITEFGDYTAVLDVVPDGYELKSGSASSQEVDVQSGDNEKIIFVVVEKTTPSPTTASITVEVRENSETGNLVPNAKVTLTNPSGVESLDNYTLASGTISVEDLTDFGKYTATFDEAPEGYILTPTCPSVKDETVNAGDSDKIIFVVEPTAKVTVSVVDKDTGDEIKDATVEVTIGTDPITGDPIKVTGTTDENGETTLDLPIKNDTVIEVTDVPDGYDPPEDKEIDVVAGTNPPVVIQVEKTDTPSTPAKLTIEVRKDSETGDLVSGGTLTVADPSGDKRINATNMTDGDEVLSDLDEFGNYTATLDVVPDGYTLKSGSSSQTVDVQSGDDEKIIFVVEETTQNPPTPTPTAKLTIEVRKDSETGDLVSGGTLTVADPSGDKRINATSMTDGDEVLSDLDEFGNYTATLDVVPDGYILKSGSSSQNADVQSGDDEKIIFVVEETTQNPPTPTPTAKLTIEVRKDSETGDLVSGGTLTVADPSGDKRINAISMTDGDEVLSDLDEFGNYTATLDVVPDGYTLKSGSSSQNADVQSGDDEKIIFVVEETTQNPPTPTPTAKLTIEVRKDSTTGTLVPGGKITVTDPDSVKKLDNVSMSDGDEVLSDLDNFGNYTATLDVLPSGYTLKSGSSSQNADVQSGDEDVIIFVVEQSTPTPTPPEVADLTITVVEEGTNNIIPGATVTIKDPSGNLVPVDPDDPSKGNVHTTDANGQIQLEDIPTGEYTAVIETVPDGYVLPSNKEYTKDVTANGNNNVEIEAPTVPATKEDLTVTVVDQKTGDPVPGATVTIIGPDGKPVPVDPADPSKGNVHTADENGQIKLEDVPTGDYEVIVETVPPGYTQPSRDPIKVTVSVGGDNELKIKIKKPSSSNNKPSGSTTNSNSGTASNEIIYRAPQTGDISYTPIAIVMMILSALGFAGIVIYRRKSER